MASSYMIGNRKATYIVKVSDTGRGRKTVIKREFTDYDAAMSCVDAMEAQYSGKYIVEFDTKFW